MTKDAALTLALEALEQIDPYVEQLIDYSSTAAEYPLNNAPRNVVKAITAIKEALAQPEQEPKTYALLYPQADYVATLDERPWVGLTDEDKCTVELVQAEVDPDWIDGYKNGLKDAEDKLKEKNI